MTMHNKSPERHLSKKDWTLLVIDAAKPDVLTPIQLQKALFLIGQRVPEAGEHDFYKFVPHNFGPFSKDVYRDVEAQKNDGFIDEIISQGQNWPEYRVSQTGTSQAALLREAMLTPALNYVDQLVKWVQAQSFRDLLHAVYAAYPHFATKSVFNG
jgi:uncharacterized protein